MRYVHTRRSIGWAVALLAALHGATLSLAQSVRLHYVARYDRQQGFPDHIMGVEAVGDHHALVSSNLALTLVDLDALPPGGTQSYVYRLGGVDAYTSVTRPDGYVYVHLRQSGLAVVYADLSAGTLSLIRFISEPDVYFEKMSVVGDRLYVAAHAYGLRLYDLTDPSRPTLAGSLDDGLDDAFAVAVAGETAYVADGAGGLKIVDLSDESAPVIIGGEDPGSAAGTAEDALIINDHVYVACGGAGVAVYDLGDIESRTLYETPICAKHLARVGEYLAVADSGGVQIFEVEPDGALTPAARESAMRRSRGGDQLSLRMWHGVSAWDDDHILAAAWDSMDVYQLVDPASDDQPDITASTQRIRFAPGGGSAVVQVTNDGSGPLQITSISTTDPAFTVEPQEASLQPGEALDLFIEYAGGAPAALVTIQSNDPDENPFPIQLFGETTNLDPGEPPIPFTLESWTFDHDTETFLYDTFDLEEHAGRIVYFHIFGTW